MMLAKGQARFELAADQPSGYVHCSYYSPPRPIVPLLTPPTHKGSDPVFYLPFKSRGGYLLDWRPNIPT